MKARTLATPVAEKCSARGKTSAARRGLLRSRLELLSFRLWVISMIVDHVVSTIRAGFKIVCSNCGALTINAVDLTGAAETAQIRYGRCDCHSWTVADLHDLARKNTGAVEFQPRSGYVRTIK